MEYVITLHDPAGNLARGPHCKDYAIILATGEVQSNGSSPVWGDIRSPLDGMATCAVFPVPPALSTPAQDAVLRINVVRDGTADSGVWCQGLVPLGGGVFSPGWRRDVVRGPVEAALYALDYNDVAGEWQYSLAGIARLHRRAHPSPSGWSPRDGSRVGRSHRPPPLAPYQARIAAEEDAFRSLRKMGRLLLQPPTAEPVSRVRLPPGYELALHAYYTQSGFDKLSTSFWLSLLHAVVVGELPTCIDWEQGSRGKINWANLHARDDHVLVGLAAAMCVFYSVIGEYATDQKGVIEAGETRPRRVVSDNLVPLQNVWPPASDCENGAQYAACMARALSGHTIALTPCPAEDQEALALLERIIGLLKKSTVAVLAVTAHSGSMPTEGEPSTDTDIMENGHALPMLAGGMRTRRSWYRRQQRRANTDGVMEVGAHGCASQSSSGTSSDGDPSLASGTAGIGEVGGISTAGGFAAHVVAVILHGGQTHYMESTSWSATSLTGLGPNPASQAADRAHRTLQIRRHLGSRSAKQSSVGANAFYSSVVCALSWEGMRLMCTEDTHGRLVCGIKVKEYNAQATGIPLLVPSNGTTRTTNADFLAALVPPTGRLDDKSRQSPGSLTLRQLAGAALRAWRVYHAECKHRNVPPEMYSSSDFTKIFSGIRPDLVQAIGPVAAQTDDGEEDNGAIQENGSPLSLLEELDHAISLLRGVISAHVSLRAAAAGPAAQPTTAVLVHRRRYDADPKGGIDWVLGLVECVAHDLEMENSPLVDMQIFVDRPILNLSVITVATKLSV